MPRVILIEAFCSIKNISFNENLKIQCIRTSEKLACIEQEISTSNCTGLQKTNIYLGQCKGPKIIVYC